MSKILLIERWIESANRRPRFWLVALALLMAVQISPWLYPAVDGCLYLKTIRDFLSAHNRLDFSCYVPPGYLPFVAPAFVFGDRPFLAVAILQWLMAVALIGGLYVWARRQFPATAVLFTTVVMVNISMWTYYRRPLKEVASMAILMWTVNLMHILLEERRLSRIIGLTAAVAFLTSYLTLIRYSAISLAVGFTLAAALLARRRAFGWSRALAMSSLVGVSAGAALFGWLYYDKIHGGGQYWQEVASVYSEAKDGPEAAPAPTPEAAPLARSASSALTLSSTPSGPPLRTALEPPPQVDSTGVRRTAEPVAAPLWRLLHGLIYRINDVGCLTVPGLWKSSVPSVPTLTVPMAVFVLLFVVIGFGWLKVVRRKLDVLALTLPVYILIYTHWVCDQPGGRFMLLMLPIITACAWYGVGVLVRRQMLVFGLLVLAHLGQSTAYWLLIDAPRAYRLHQNWAMVDRLAEEIRRRPGQVAIADAIQSDCQGLWLELDWGCRLQGLEKALAPSVTWVVDEAGKTPVEGFSVCRVDGPVQLLHRNTPRPLTPSMVGKIDSSSREAIGNP